MPNQFADPGGVLYVDAADLAPAGGHYSHVCVAQGLAFISGQLPITPQGRKMTEASFEEQARQVLSNLAAALEAAGSGIELLTQVRVYVDDIENWPSFNTIYQAWAGRARPARSVVPTGPLHFGLKIEVEAVAVVEGVASVAS